MFYALFSHLFYHLLLSGRSDPLAGRSDPLTGHSDPLTGRSDPLNRALDRLVDGVQACLPE